MTKIQQLSPSVINKIAAGEVIERPASVVKELMENSVDAGSLRIDITVQKGGSELMRVSDDGCGISSEELPWAVASHATSKISSADDLFQVSTLGFRGEALASISEVSHLRIRSRTKTSSSGSEMEIHGGKRSDIAPCSSGPGTSIEVRNLFFNTPVRRKFLRTTQTEMGHISEAFTRVALGCEHVHFTLQHNDRTIYDLPPTEHWLDRLAALFGRELAEDLLWVESQESDMGLAGFVANPTHSRSNNRMQYLFVNSRYVRDRSLSHALSEAYRGLLLTGRFPIAFLKLTIPPETIDVNVHPTKLEVRFQDGGNIYGQLLGTLRTRFLNTDLTKHVGTATPPPQTSWSSPTANPGVNNNAFGVTGPGTVSSSSTTADEMVPEVTFAGTQSRLDLSPATPLTESSPNVPGWATGEKTTTPPSETYETTFMETSTQELHEQAVQIHSCYLITECSEGVVVIDQHALHERILYEELREKVLDEEVEVQRLLVPEPIQLSAEEAAAVLDAKDTIAKLGIEIEPFGGNTVVISAYPAMLANLKPEEVLRQVVSRLTDAGEKTPERRDMLDDLLHMISCKAAIKAGDHLTQEEMQSLLSRRHLVQDSHHCPHGRPTTLVFTREQLDKHFQRT